MRLFISTLPLACLLATHAPAQASVAATALTPLTFTTTVGGNTCQPSQPAGPIASNLMLPCSLPNTSVEWRHATEVTETSVRIGCGIDVDLGLGAADPSISLPQTELLFEVSAPQAMPFYVDFDHLWGMPAGTPTPLMEIDVGDDGAVEWRNGNLVLFQSPGFHLIGPQPLRVRVRVAWQAPQAQEGRWNFGLTLEPYPYILTDKVVEACYVSSLRVQSTFVPQTLRLLPSWPSGPGFLVLGMATEVVVVPASQTATPCILVPSHDVVIPAIAGVPIDLRVPPAARPLQFYSQAVHDLSGWVTGEAYHHVAF